MANVLDADGSRAGEDGRRARPSHGPATDPTPGSLLAWALLRALSFSIQRADLTNDLPGAVLEPRVSGETLSLSLSLRGGKNAQACKQTSIGCRRLVNWGVGGVSPPPLAARQGPWSSRNAGPSYPQGKEVGDATSTRHGTGSPRCGSWAGLGGPLRSAPDLPMDLSCYKTYSTASWKGKARGPSGKYGSQQTRSTTQDSGNPRGCALPSARFLAWGTGCSRLPCVPCPVHDDGGMEDEAGGAHPPPPHS